MISPTKEEIARAASLIRAGALVAMPTETVYGLAANALDPHAVRKIYEAKGRPSTCPLIVHVDSLAMARSLVESWTDAAQKLAERWWPGPLTIILPKKPLVPDIVTAGLGTVALRMPAHAVALQLIRDAGVPIAAPSANRFTQLSPTTADHVRESLGDRVPMILDGGPCKVGIESTVVSLAGSQPVLLRPGTISAKQIEAIIGPLGEYQPSGEADPSPGLHARHYSPSTPLFLNRAGEGGAGCWLELSNMPADPAGYATALYDRLHRLDRDGLDWIAVESPPDLPEWAGVLDRLRRAAAR